MLSILQEACTSKITLICVRHAVKKASPYTKGVDLQYQHYPTGETGGGTRFHPSGIVWIAKSGRSIPE